MSTSLSATIMEFLTNIFGSEEARAEFLEDPEGYMAAHNLDDLSCADFDDAVVSFFENAEFENESGDNNQGGTFNVNVAGPTVPHDGQSDHEAIAQHLTEIVHEYGDTYITNNDNDVVNDNSFQGQIFADGDVTFDNDITSASGDGAVAAGDDIDGDVVTGDGNVIGDDNQVGDGSAFGDGANSGSISADDGSTVSLAGDDATSTGNNSVDNSDNSVENEDSFNDNSDSSDNSDNSVDASTDVDVDVELEESFNDNSDNSRETETETTVTNTNDDGIQTAL